MLEAKAYRVGSMSANVKILLNNASVTTNLPSRRVCLAQIGRDDELVNFLRTGMKNQSSPVPRGRGTSRESISTKDTCSDTMVASTKEGGSKDESDTGVPTDVCCGLGASLQRIKQSQSPLQKGKQRN